MLGHPALYFLRPRRSAYLVMIVVIAAMSSEFYCSRLLYSGGQYLPEMFGKLSEIFPASLVGLYILSIILICEISPQNSRISHMLLKTRTLFPYAFIIIAYWKPKQAEEWIFQFFSYVPEFLIPGFTQGCISNLLIGLYFSFQSWIRPCTESLCRESCTAVLNPKSCTGK